MASPLAGRFIIIRRSWVYNLSREPNWNKKVVSMGSDDAKRDTQIVSGGRESIHTIDVVNPPLYRASTILHPDTASLGSPDTVFGYGRRGSPTRAALENAMAALDGGFKSLLAPSGLAAITTTFLSTLNAGDHLLVTDGCYSPTRTFCNNVLKRFGVEVTYYDPTIGDGIRAVLQENTKVVFLESPSSQTFEIQDTRAITTAAKEVGAISVLDNTWATPLLFRPFDHGVDICVQSITKYIAGHSDVLLGSITGIEDVWKAFPLRYGALGMNVSPDDAYLALRGLRTLGVRMPRHHANALRVAQWLTDHDQVARVLHPALPEHAQHDIWKRDFLGACGTFGVVLQPAPQSAVAAMLDHLDHFGLGFSFGGFESLAIPTHPEKYRTATTWSPEGPCIRLHIGLEDPDDLIKDLDRGFKRLRDAS
jgi:cystathionine beta-lyase